MTRVDQQIFERTIVFGQDTGVKHETVIYPGAQHAFFNDTRAAYHPEAAADAWQRMIALFRKTLGD